jgi:hypothetical protein
MNITIGRRYPLLAAFRGKNVEVRIPYSALTSIEYGQKARRRVGAAIATAILLSPVGLALLFSHKRKHILTLGWTVDGHNEAAGFELGQGQHSPGGNGAGGAQRPQDGV